MPQARRRTRQKGAGNGLPGWAMLTIGLIIGLFVAFLVYLDDLQEPPSAAVSARDDAGGSGSDVARGEAGDEGEDDKPRFEFYSILPELEVVVPDQPKDEPRSPAGGDTDAGTDAPASESGAPVEADGTFYLQAGSFRKADQADRLKAKISLIGLDVAIQTVDINGERWHRVRVGPYSDQQALRSAQKRLRDNDIDYLVLREKSSG